MNNEPLTEFLLYKFSTGDIKVDVFIKAEKDLNV